VTPLFTTSLATVAVNSCCAVTNRLAFVGTIETEMFWAWTVGAKTDEIQAINSTVFSLRMFLLLFEFRWAWDFKAIGFFYLLKNATELTVHNG